MKILLPCVCSGIVIVIAIAIGIFILYKTRENYALMRDLGDMKPYDPSMNKVPVFLYNDDQEDISTSSSIKYKGHRERDKDKRDY